MSSTVTVPTCVADIHERLNKPGKIVDPEKVNLAVFHSPILPSTVEHHYMTGAVAAAGFQYSTPAYIRNCSGSTAMCTMTESGAYKDYVDHFNLSYIMDFVGGFEQCRSSSCQVIIDVHYNAARPPIWNPYAAQDFTYTYTFRLSKTILILDLELDQFLLDNGTSPSTQYDHYGTGISFKILVSGQMFLFDPLQLLLLITASFTILGLSDDVVDTIALNVWRHKKEFAEAKYHESIDFDTQKCAQEEDASIMPLKNWLKPSVKEMKALKEKEKLKAKALKEKAKLQAMKEKEKIKVQNAKLKQAAKAKKTSKAKKPQAVTA